MHLAKKMIEDRSRDYMNARRVAKVCSCHDNLAECSEFIAQDLLDDFFEVMVLVCVCV